MRAGFNSSTKVLVCGALFFGSLSFSTSASGLKVSKTVLNRRFTENPYVPPLVFGEAVEAAKKNFTCPKVLILGFRGSGEGPKEFKVKDPGLLLGSGQEYTNWTTERGFTIPEKYKKSKYTTNSAPYTDIFGETVGSSVKVTREQIAKLRGLKISEVGIWSVGVDDLHFSTENPPQSAYHAAGVSWKYQPYLNLMRNSITQFEGGLVESFDGKGSQINSLYFALMLFRKFCPDLDGLYLIGYSSGAVMARFMAANSVAKTLVSGDLVDPNGLPRRALFLIADPLFDGKEVNFFEGKGICSPLRKPPCYNHSEPQTVSEAFWQLPGLANEQAKSLQGAKGILKWGRGPKFNRENNGYSALQEDFAITTFCRTGDPVCATPTFVFKLLFDFHTLYKEGRFPSNDLLTQICEFLRHHPAYVSGTRTCYRNP